MTKRGSFQSGARRRALEAESRKWPEQLVPVPFEQWPAAVALHGRVFQVWRSRRYLVQGFLEEGGVLRLTICRAALNVAGGWEDGLGWDQLQAIKAECGFGAREAVEVYPPDRDVVNVANFRHLWVLPEGLPFTWRRSS